MPGTPFPRRRLCRCSNRLPQDGHDSSQHDRSAQPGSTGSAYHTAGYWSSQRGLTSATVMVMWPQQATSVGRAQFQPRHLQLTARVTWAVGSYCLLLVLATKIRNSNSASSLDRCPTLPDSRHTNEDAQPALCLSTGKNVYVVPRYARM